MASPGAVDLESLRSAAPEMLEEWRVFLRRKSPPGKRLEDMAELKAALDAYGGSLNLANDPGCLTFPIIAAALRDPDWPRMWITPTADADVRHLRPYFLVPLLEVGHIGEQTLLRNEIAEYVQKYGVNEVFVVSHGWHRNYFAAVSVYDRLLSRFGTLCARGRIDMKGVQPLFIALHWHSDPGENSWADPAGRRHRDSFIERVRELFEPRDGVPSWELLSDFEDVFAEMSRISAPDEEPSDVPMGRITEVSRRLKKYRIRDVPEAIPAPPAPPATPPGYENLPDEHLDQKVATLWRCYVESQSKALLVDQAEEPRAFGSTLDAVSTLVKFAVALAGPVAVVQGLLGGKGFKEQVVSFYESLTNLLRNAGVPRSVPTAVVLVPSTVVACVLVLYALAYFRRRARRAQEGEGPESARGFPLAQALAWLPLQILATLPLFTFLLVTWIFRTPLALIALVLFFAESYLAVPALGQRLIDSGSGTAAFVGHHLGSLAVIALSLLLAAAQHATGASISGLFRERLRSSGDRAQNARDYLAAIARYPINIVRPTIGRDSGLQTVINGVENQLAFFQYQRKGVDAGQDAGYFIRDLLAVCPALRDKRIHFIGHSFGGLVVLNAVREILSPRRAEVKPYQVFRRNRTRKNWEIRNLQKEIRAYAATPSTDTKDGYDETGQKTVHSLSLVQAAVASSWFVGESWAQAKAGKNDGVRGAIACIYSKYDTANGFYYPFANNGRLAAGYVGLCATSATPIGHRGEFVMLNAPPVDLLRGGQTRFLNLDGSRLIYEGPVATGGGHDDIFKDDIVHLLWAVTRL